MAKEKVWCLVKNLPELPGIYKYFDKSGALIYIGKAKNLKKRVSSYFTKAPEDKKTFNLIQNIHHLEIIIVTTEQEALLLENFLIKHFQPRYNINLKDDKSYPYIIIKNETFPRVFLTRNRIDDGSEYFGPFTSVLKISALLEVIRILFPLRKNHLDLFMRITQDGKLKIDPEYYLNKRETVQILSKQEYSQNLVQVRNILGGKLKPIITFLRSEMKIAIEKTEFEKAEALRQKLEFIKEYKSNNGVVVNSKGDTLDVFTILFKPKKVYIGYLQVRNGGILQLQTTEIHQNFIISAEKILVSAIISFRKRMKSSASELLVPFPIDYPDKSLKIKCPVKGRKKKLLDISMKNLIYCSGSTNNE